MLILKFNQTLSSFGLALITWVLPKLRNPNGIIQDLVLMEQMEHLFPSEFTQQMYSEPGMGLELY